MKLAYDVTLPSCGEQNSIPIVLLHGGVYSRLSWKRIAPNLASATGRKVYAVDLRNHGESPRAKEFSFDVLVEDLDEFLKDHQIAKAALVGHSMGAKIAMTYALKKPEKVDKLVAEEMVVGPYSKNTTKTILHTFQVVKKALDVIRKGSDITAAKEAIQEYIKSSLPEEMSMTGTLYDFETVPLKQSGDSYVWQFDVEALEEKVKVNESKQNLTGVFKGDALFLYGTKSFFEVDKDELITTVFPQAVKVPFEGAGHLLHHDHPEKYVEEVSKFILGRSK